VTSGTHSGAGAQQIAVNYNDGAGGFSFFNTSGLGPNSIHQLNGTTPGLGVAGDASTNLSMESIGSIGFWLKAGVITGSPNLSASILLDDEAAGTEIGVARPVPADGLWHKYEWLINDNNEWDNFSGGNGRINGAYFSIDSIRFTGLTDATFTLDDVFYDAAAVPEPAGALMMVACLALVRRRRRAAA
jgi:hypothetical protein